MSDYLRNLVARSLEPAEALRPRLPSLFEPPLATEPAGRHRFSWERLAPLSETEGSQTALTPQAPPAAVDLSGALLTVTKGEPPTDVLQRHRTLRAAPPTPQPKQGGDQPATPTSVEPAELRSEASPHPPSPAPVHPPASRVLASTPETTPQALSDGRPTQTPALDPPSGIRPTRREAGSMDHTLLRPAVAPNESLPPVTPRAESLGSSRAPLPMPAVNGPHLRLAAPVQPIESGIGVESTRVVADRTQAAPMPGARAPVPVAVVVQPRVVPGGELTESPMSPAPARATAAPTIQVTIGRVEVKAISPPLAPPKQRLVPPAMSLQEYLHRRASGGER